MGVRHWLEANRKRKYQRSVGTSICASRRTSRTGAHCLRGGGSRLALRECRGVQAKNGSRGEKKFKEGTRKLGALHYVREVMSDNGGEFRAEFDLFLKNHERLKASNSATKDLPRCVLARRETHKFRQFPVGESEKKSGDQVLRMAYITWIEELKDYCEARGFSEEEKLNMLATLLVAKLSRSYNTSEGDFEERIRRIEIKTLSELVRLPSC